MDFAAIGGVEIERLKESRSRGQLGSQRKTTSHNNERQIEPLVMDSEISGLADLHGYLKSENLVVRMSFPIIALPNRLPGYIQRSMEMSINLRLIHLYLRSFAVSASLAAKF